MRAQGPFKRFLNGCSMDFKALQGFVRQCRAPGLPQVSQKNPFKTTGSSKGSVNSPLEGNRADPRKMPMENPIHKSRDHVPTLEIKGGVSHDLEIFVQDFLSQFSDDPPVCLPMATPYFLSKKHVKFDQGLDFLKFYQRNRGQTAEKHKRIQEK